MAIKTTINRSIQTVELEFPSHGKLTFHAERCSEALRTYAMLDRFQSKIVDCMALERAKFPNSTIPEAVKFERASAMVGYLESGTEEWNQGRQGTGSSERNLLGRALTEAGRTFKPEWLKERTAAQVTAMLADGRLKEIVDKLRAEGSSGVNTDDLFAELDAVDDETEEEAA